MAFKVGVGKSDFAELRKDGNYYVDKTELIYELANDTENEVTLFTRPRRFGKTLMMSMMENFFSIRKDSRDIFEGLTITKHEAFCKEWMNQYPVLFISFKDIEAENFIDALAVLKTRLADVSKTYADLAKEKAVNSFDAKKLVRLQDEKCDLADVKNSLKTIMRMLYAAYGKKVILLIDEYDVPLAKASEKNTSANKYYDLMLDVIKGMLSIALKDNEYLKFGVVTGCLRIAKESIFTGTNNFASYSVLDSRFSEYFGFTEKEVEKMLLAADRSEKASVIKEWYDGYVFGKSSVYCPWDVINYLSELRFDSDAKPKNYWKNTSHNGILLTFVKHTDFDVADKFESLLNGGTVIQTISDALTYDTLHSSEDNLWSVLLMTGYITKADLEEAGETVALKIPNRELSSIFEDAVVKFFNETVSNDTIKELLNALWEKNEAEASRLLSDLLWNTISYHDYHEDYYHAFLAGVFAGRGYSVASNKEKGLGRPDLEIKDKKNRRVIIIEAKKSVKESDMDKDCSEAIKQIRVLKYADSIDEGFKQVLCYGIAFYKKKAKVICL
ncbi:MAG: AAA family ATPase [Lachnospiraceae bacterium]|nr:AAA family ATPase [Lachnospiraceae bacterium]